MKIPYVVRNELRASMLALAEKAIDEVLCKIFEPLEHQENFSTGWLLEVFVDKSLTSRSTHLYLTWSQDVGSICYTPAAESAIRFAREEDALAMLACLRKMKPDCEPLSRCRPIQHMWDGGLNK